MIESLPYWTSAILSFLILPKIWYIIYSRKKKNFSDPWTNTECHWFVDFFMNSLVDFARTWHDYKIHGIENVSSRNCLLVGYHSRPTVDIVYCIAHLRPASLISHIFFSIPFMTPLLKLGNFISSSKAGYAANETFVDALVNGDRPVLLLPGGAYECEKPYDERYIVGWKKLPGYARILLQAPKRPGEKTKVIPFFTNNCEELYTNNSKWFDYSGNVVRKGLDDLRVGKFWIFPFLFPIAALSLGFSWIPHPVKLDLYIGKPIVAKKHETPLQFAERVRSALQVMIDEVRCKTKSIAETEVEVEGLEHSRSLLSYMLKFPLLFLYTIMQNAFIFSYLVGSVMLLSPVAIIAQGTFYFVRSISAAMFGSAWKHPHKPTDR